MGLVNNVVPLAELEARPCVVPGDAAALAVRVAPDEGQLQRRRGRVAGIQQLAHDANLLFYGTDEAAEGREAFKAKREPDFARFPRRGVTNATGTIARRKSSIWSYQMRKGTRKP